LGGRDVDERLGDETVLVTNAHVLHDTFGEAIHPKDAVVCFTAFDGVRPGEAFRVKTLCWSSLPDQLDCTVARLDRPPGFPLEACYPIAARLPNKGDRVLIIGHPSGGPLQLSINDNELLDYDDPPTRRLHYRTPTEGGSSGSPVFNQLWQLVGLHHAAGDEVARLNGQTGSYQANEGIAIALIVETFRAQFRP
jgi:hypothetical protein